MGIEIHIKRMQIFAQYIYEISVSGDVTFEERYIVALENTLDTDLPKILDLCSEHQNFVIQNITKIAIKYSLMNVSKIYTVEYKPTYKDIFTVYVQFNKTDRKYVFPFDDYSQKDDSVINIFFDEWNKAVKYLQKIYLEQLSTKYSTNTRLLIDKESLSVDENLLINNKSKTITMGIVKKENSFQMCVSWKNSLRYYDLNNENVNQYPLDIVFFLKQMLYDSNISKVKTVTVLLKYPGLIKLIFSRKNSILQFTVIYKDITIGSVKLSTDDMSEKIKSELADYPEVLIHISDWRKSFIYVDKFFKSYIQTPKSQPLNISKVGHSNSIKIQWEKAERIKSVYYVYKRYKGTRPVLLMMTQNTYYYDMNIESQKTQYAVYAAYNPIPVNSIKFQDKDFYSVNASKQSNDVSKPQSKPIKSIQEQNINKPQPKPIKSIQVGDVYYNKSATPCGHRFWKVDELYKNNVLIKCTQCKMLRNISFDELMNDYSFSYSNPPTNTILKQRPITSADVVVLSSSKRCTAQHHRVEDYIGLLPVTTKFGCNKIEINVSYCKDCERFTMLKSEYLKIVGTPVCEVRDLSTNKIINHSSNDFFGETKEHKLHRLGYNVRYGNGMSNFDRQRLLARIINNKELSRDEIISHIEYCININSNKPNMDLAVRKWKMDLEFLHNFKPDAEKVAIGSITLKYNKAKH